MAFVVQFVKTVRNNWKKTLFLSGLAIYGGKYANDKYEESLLRTAYCREAKKYGDVPLRAGEKSRRVTVFLNPAARKGRGRKFFDKNVAPLLHLAGLEVTVIKTEYEGQAKKYMEVLENTDAVIVAGGDGTLLEVVTGMLRRADAAKFGDIPVGFIPIGYRNWLARLLTVKAGGDAAWQIEAAMAVVKGITRKVDVMHIKSEDDKSVYAVNGIEWGILTDVRNRQTKNWYFGQAKYWWAYVRETLRMEWPPLLEGHLHYSLPCSGCSRCYTPPPQPVWRWWHILWAPKQHIPPVDYSTIDNSECGVVHEEKVATMQLDIATANSPETKGEEGLTMKAAPEKLSRSEFISEGWKREKGAENRLPHILRKAGEIQFVPQVPEGKEMFYTIDNEKFEVLPIKVQFLKDRLNMFCSQGNQPFVSLPHKQTWIS